MAGEGGHACIHPVQNITKRLMQGKHHLLIVSQGLYNSYIKASYPYKRIAEIEAKWLLWVEQLGSMLPFGQSLS